MTPDLSLDELLDDGFDLCQDIDGNVFIVEGDTVDREEDPQ